jgi:hypothetical protein
MGWSPNTLITFESITEQIKLSSASVELYMPEMNFDRKPYAFSIKHLPRAKGSTSVYKL